ncbi:Uncharacterised protein [Mycoplasmopsis maculosa]|uniref:Lipoprotein n=1 Tax=Mycoplasmopsis maculosa TaxID=114885 RepID=A0A449B3Y2_9BACT|nr:variable surface lipoprotein [Mycoplasmopsis maculosa]VEU75314.1 Uncharacterised protein [Mycoplasmopsis maculosa]
MKNKILKSMLLVSSFSIPTIAISCNNPEEPKAEDSQAKKDYSASLELTNYYGSMLNETEKVKFDEKLKEIEDSLENPSDTKYSEAKTKLDEYRTNELLNKNSVKIALLEKIRISTNVEVKNNSPAYIKDLKAIHDEIETKYNELKNNKNEEEVSSEKAKLYDLVNPKMQEAINKMK